MRGLDRFIQWLEATGLDYVEVIWGDLEPRPRVGRSHEDRYASAPSP